MLQVRDILPEIKQKDEKGINICRGITSRTLRDTCKQTFINHRPSLYKTTSINTLSAKASHSIRVGKIEKITDILAQLIFVILKVNFQYGRAYLFIVVSYMLCHDELEFKFE